MLPLTRCACTRAGREGSARGTAIWLLPGDSAKSQGTASNEITANMNWAQRLRRVIVLFMAFENAYVSIQIVRFDFHPTSTHPASGVTIAVIDELAVMTLAGGRLGRQRGHFKI